MSLVIDIDLRSSCLLLHRKAPIDAASGLSMVREFASMYDSVAISFRLVCQISGALSNPLFEHKVACVLSSILE